MTNAARSYKELSTEWSVFKKMERQNKGVRKIWLFLMVKINSGKVTILVTTHGELKFLVTNYKVLMTIIESSSHITNRAEIISESGIKFLDLGDKHEI